MVIAVKDAFSLVLGSIGAVLGVMNTVHSLNQRRVHLRVVAKVAVLTPDGEAFLTHVKNMEQANWGCIEVTNLGSFPVPIAEVGFTIEGPVLKGRRLPILEPFTLDRAPFQRMLQPHQSLAGYFPASAITPAIQKAYARTDSDELGYGRNNAAMTQLKQIAQGR